MMSSCGSILKKMMSQVYFLSFWKSLKFSKGFVRIDFDQFSEFFPISHKMFVIFSDQVFFRIILKFSSKDIVMSHSRLSIWSRWNFKYCIMNMRLRSFQFSYYMFRSSRMRKVVVCRWDWFAVLYGCFKLAFFDHLFFFPFGHEFIMKKFLIVLFFGVVAISKSFEFSLFEDSFLLLGSYYQFQWSHCV